MQKRALYAFFSLMSCVSSLYSMYQPGPQYSRVPVTNVLVLPSDTKEFFYTGTLAIYDRGPEIQAGTCQYALSVNSLKQVIHLETDKEEKVRLQWIEYVDKATVQEYQSVIVVITEEQKKAMTSFLTKVEENNQEAMKYYYKKLLEYSYKVEDEYAIQNTVEVPKRRVGRIFIKNTRNLERINKDNNRQ
jgi:hypothetical protein